MQIIWIGTINRFDVLSYGWSHSSPWPCYQQDPQVIRSAITFHPLTLAAPFSFFHHSIKDKQLAQENEKLRSKARHYPSWEAGIWSKNGWTRYHACKCTDERFKLQFQDEVKWKPCAGWSPHSGSEKSCVFTPSSSQCAIGPPVAPSAKQWMGLLPWSIPSD